MPNTYQKIASVTVGAGGVAPVTFSSIPATYTDLLVRCSVRSADANVYGRFSLQFNGDGGNNYTYKHLYGNGSTTTSTGQTTVNAIYGLYTNNGANSTANTFASQDIYIPNYAGSSYKSTSLDAGTENNATEAYVTINAGIWLSTAAINSITLTTAGTGANFSQYSTFTLYGILNS